LKTSCLRKQGLEIYRFWWYWETTFVWLLQFDRAVFKWSCDTNKWFVQFLFIKSLIDLGLIGGLSTRGESHVEMQDAHAWEKHVCDLRYMLDAHVWDKARDKARDLAQVKAQVEVTCDKQGMTYDMVTSRAWRMTYRLPYVICTSHVV